jgi:hypothetical protein
MIKTMRAVAGLTVAGLLAAGCAQAAPHQPAARHSSTAAPAAQTCGNQLRSWVLNRKFVRVGSDLTKIGSVPAADLAAIGAAGKALLVDAEAVLDSHIPACDRMVHRDLVVAMNDFIKAARDIEKVMDGAIGDIESATRYLAAGNSIVRRAESDFENG